MRLNLLIALAIAALVAAATLWLNRADQIEFAELDPVSDYAGTETLPDVSFTDLQDGTHRFDDWKGRAVIVNFWASWCAPCVVEMPQLLAIAERHPKDVVLVLMSVDSDKGDIGRFFEMHALSPAQNVVIVQDEGKAISKDLFGTILYPETILADRSGVMRQKIAGAVDWTAPDIKALLSDLLTD